MLPKLYLNCATLWSLPLRSGHPLQTCISMFSVTASEDLLTRRWPGLPYQIYIPCPGHIGGSSMCNGEFPLEGLLRLREREISAVPCMECAETHDISTILTGFTLPGQPHGIDPTIIHGQLDRIEAGIVRVEVRAADIAEYVRRIMRIVSIEITDCPRFFSLISEQPTGNRRLRFDRNHYRLTLWCEHPGYWHPWIPASYELDQTKEWVTRIKPYIKLAFMTLRLVVPLTGSIVVAGMPKEQLEQAQAHLDLMKTIVEDLPTLKTQEEIETPSGHMKRQLTLAEGEALRAFRAVLFEHDSLRNFGGMRRVQEPSGDFLWVCPKHYLEYDPGLPTIP